jgi:hypothetical protein
MGHEISISRNDDEQTVDFYPPFRAIGQGVSTRKNVPLAEVGAEVARLAALGHRVVCTSVVARKLAAAGADVSGTVRPT